MKNLKHNDILKLEFKNLLSITPLYILQYEIIVNNY